jgi:hypothetical protein
MGPRRRQENQRQPAPQEWQQAPVPQQHQNVRQSVNQNFVPQAYVLYPGQEHVPAYFTNQVYHGMDMMDELEEVLSIHSSASVDPSGHNDVAGTNGVPVGNVSPSYDPWTPDRAQPSTSSGSMSSQAGVPTSAQNGAQINIQTSTQATVQTNSQQAVPPAQAIRNYSTTVPPPGMKILKKKDGRVDEAKEAHPLRFLERKGRRPRSPVRAWSSSAPRTKVRVSVNLPRFSRTESHVAGARETESMLYAHTRSN